LKLVLRVPQQVQGRQVLVGELIQQLELLPAAKAGLLVLPVQKKQLQIPIR
jgi:hypothetical protein